MRHRLSMDHRRVELALDRLEAVLDRTDDAALGALADVRLGLSRQMLAHVASEDAHVFAALRDDPRPDAVEIAACFRAERSALLARIEAHGRRYWNDATIGADREGHASRMRPLIAAIRCMMEREEMLLYPLLARIPAAAGQR